jgi:hypothetical protein
MADRRLSAFLCAATGAALVLWCIGSTANKTHGRMINAGNVRPDPKTPNRRAIGRRRNQKVRSY